MAKLPLLAGTGCLVCGGALRYSGAAEPAACALCGGSLESTARCVAGHYVCDRCHAAPASEAIQDFCARTELRDPVEIARILMRHPGVQMHGPEHHFLVPAALVAAWANATSVPAERRGTLLAEARRRSAPVLGGFCGIQGACGAAIGTGIFVALATESTPLKGRERGLANEMTSRALALVSGTAGPRCCKRDGLLSILAGVRFARERLGVALPARGRACEFTGRNAECIHRRCPFYPRAQPGTGR